MRHALVALAFLIASACGGGAANRAADITGSVTSVSGRADGVTGLVESEPSHPSIGDKASVAVNANANTSTKVEAAAGATTLKHILTRTIGP